ncbi:MAG: hypoxanthine phosphoribosyltransferase [Acidobacteria bacterium]|nr:hypoxanthine phosphoribosyltransferase [Acidobacteriota bacterium]
MQVIFSEEQIGKRVREMASQISSDYGSDEVHAIGILDDSFMFLADLVRGMTCPVVCHFIKMEKQDTVVGAQPVCNIVYGPVADIAGKNVLLVDAVVDSGITLDHLVQQLLLKNAKSVRTAALVDREERRRLPFRVDYAGFTWQGSYLVGYGLDDERGLYRNFPYVAAISASENAASTEAAKGGTVTQ